MWNITPEDVTRIKEELNGRHAAIHARYADDIQRLRAELDDIESFERVATAFAERYKRDEQLGSAGPDPIVPVEELPTRDLAVETEGTDQLTHHPENRGEIEIVPEVEALLSADVSVAQKAATRWRMRPVD